MNLRELYKERGSRNINTTVLEKREASMEEILEGDRLEYSEWKLLTDWLVGIAGEDEETENVLIKLEGIFCEEDETFSKENESEMHILAGELIYRYCEKTKEKSFPLRVLCGYNSGYKVKSELIYRGFVQLLNEWRLDMRRDEGQKESIMLPDIEEIQRTIKDKQEAAENAGYNWAADQEDWDEALKVLKSCKEAIDSFITRNEQFQKILKVQREESDILWWMINEWSDIYEQSFAMLKREQLALTAPLELQEMIPCDLGPFAVRQVLRKVIFLTKNSHQKISLSQLIDAADDKLFAQRDFSKWSSCKVQPVLTALQCRQKAGEEGWKGFFSRECAINPDEIKMYPEEFAYQFYLELELASL